jgi:hypothetical protein
VDRNSRSVFRCARSSPEQVEGFLQDAKSLVVTLLITLWLMHRWPGLVDPELDFEANENRNGIAFERSRLKLILGNGSHGGFIQAHLQVS